jgi:hypothetical protein
MKQNVHQFLVEEQHQANHRFKQQRVRVPLPTSKLISDIDVEG